MPTPEDRISRIRSFRGAEVDAQRRAAAVEEAALLDAVVALVADGMTIKDALAQKFPDAKYPSMARRLRRYGEGGVDALYNKRLAPVREDLPRDLGEHIVALGKVLRGKTASDIQALLASEGVEVSLSTVTSYLRDAGLTRGRGRPAGRRSAAPKAPATPVEPRPVETDHPLAGAELLRVLDEIDGCTLKFAKVLQDHALGLPTPEVTDEEDPNDRDERGRFRPSYNRAKPRRFERQNSKFDSARFRRITKDPKKFRFTQTSLQAVHLKVRAIVMSPVVVQRGRITELRHGLEERLGVLTGRTLAGSTLYKFLSEAKVADVGEVLQEAWLDHVLEKEGEAVDGQTGAVVLYGDATTHPHYTRLFELSTKVSQINKVAPGVTTVTLNSARGMTLQYAAYSGHADVGKVVFDMLEHHAERTEGGEASRLVVLDRESHAVQLFKRLSPNWLFIIPLRSNVTGNPDLFSDMTPWAPWKGTAEICEAKLLLRDRRKGEKSLLIRVVGLRRHPEGQVLWFATNSTADPFTPAHVVRLYFDRWPRQEARYRDAKGRVALHRQHGYGKEEIDNVTVITRLEEIEVTKGQLKDQLYDAACDLVWCEQEGGPKLEKAVQLAEQEEVAAAQALGASAGAAQAALRAVQDKWTRSREALQQAKTKLQNQGAAEEKARRTVQHLAARYERLSAEEAEIGDRRRVFRLDTELDEIQLAFKCTFIRLCGMLQTLLRTKLEIDTLITRVLTLPGRCITSADGKRREVLLYRNPRDVEMTTRLESACAELNRRLGEERLRMVDRPPGWIR